MSAKTETLTSEVETLTGENAHLEAERDNLLLENEQLRELVHALKTRIAEQIVSHAQELHQARRIPAAQFEQAVKAGWLAHGRAHNGQFAQRSELVAAAIAQALGVEVAR